MHRLEFNIQYEENVSVEAYNEIHFSGESTLVCCPGSDVTRVSFS